MDADKMQELFDVYKDLIDEQTEYAIDLGSKLELFGVRSNFNELNIILLLDALACTGLQLVPITEENIPSLAVLRYSVANSSPITPPEVGEAPHPRERNHHGA